MALDIKTVKSGGTRAGEVNSFLHAQILLYVKVA
jgi:hypothetical protein